jgi:hypothetical protein
MKTDWLKAAVLGVLRRPSLGTKKLVGSSSTALDE